MDGAGEGPGDPGPSGPRSPGEMDLATMLASLTVSRRPGRYTVVPTGRPVEVGRGVEAVLVEAEGPTAVATVETARHHGWPVTFEAAWLTVEVHSSLEAVGLTAALSTALADVGIACNVLAGFHHDHLLVPHSRADEAERALLALRHPNRSNGR